MICAMPVAYAQEGKAILAGAALFVFSLILAVVGYLLYTRRRKKCLHQKEPAPSVAQYVESMMQQGYDPMQIQSQLLQQGLTQGQIEEAYRQIMNK